MYYWMYLGNATTVLSSGSFTFPTTGCNAVGYVKSSDDTCGDLKIELDSTYVSNSAIVYINALTIVQEVYLSAALQGTVSATVPTNTLVVDYTGSLSLQDKTASFCETGGARLNCTYSGSADVTAPQGGNYLTEWSPRSHTRSLSITPCYTNSFIHSFMIAGAIFVLAFTTSGGYRYIQAFTGVGSVTWEVDFDLDLDLDNDIAIGVLLGIIFGAIGFCCCCCVIGFVLLKKRKTNKAEMKLKIELKQDLQKDNVDSAKC